MELRRFATKEQVQTENRSKQIEVKTPKKSEPNKPVKVEKGQMSLFETDGRDKDIEFAKSIEHLQAVEVLGYGSHGRYKWEEIFGHYELKDVPDAETKDVSRVADLFEEQGIRTI